MASSGRMFGKLPRWLLVIAGIAIATNAGTQTSFTDEELGVAQFWEDMGPTLRDYGIDAYAARYHADFEHWDIGNGGGLATKDGAIKAWTRFHEGGNRITCTHVTPVSVRIIGDHAFARLIYEQTDTSADGDASTTFWRLATLFERQGGSWQVLDSNMIRIDEPGESDGEDGGPAHKCPGLD